MIGFNHEFVANQEISATDSNSPEYGEPFLLYRGPIPRHLRQLVRTEQYWDIRLVGADIHQFKTNGLFTRIRPEDDRKVVVDSTEFLSVRQGVFQFIQGIQ